MKKSIVYLFIAGFFVFTIISCKKNDNNSSNNNNRESLIVGTFQLSATGEDANNNNQLDNGEFDLIPAGATLRDVFRADKTGMGLTTTPGSTTVDTTQFTYSLINNNTQLKVVSGTSTSVSQIITLNSSTLSGYDITSNPHRIIILTKL